MTHIRIKLLVASVVLTAAVAYLGFAGVKKGWVYTVAVDNYLADTSMQDQRVRICGKVSDQNLTINKAGLSALFTVQGTTKSMPVAYHGIVPDLFKPGCEVLVEGRRDEAGIFQSDVIMTKCASKYDEAPKGHPTERTTASLTEVKP